jgi:hypothetical protein
MSRPQTNPLRRLTPTERRELGRLRRSRTAPTAEVARAALILLIGDGHGYQDAARAIGRKSGDAVAHLVARFNREGLAAVTPRLGGGRATTYGTAARERILREAARTPTPEADGTATWSLSILRRVLRSAPTACRGSRRSPSGRSSGRPGIRSSIPAPGARPGTRYAAARPAG